MKDLSPVFFDMTRVTPEQVKQMNEEHHRMMLRQDPHWDEKRAQFEQQVQLIASNKKVNPHPQSTITIPVVVHLVYKTSAQNISDAQIQSQIRILNEDFGRTNPDTSDTPSAFLPLAANTGIQFCFATRDPNGFPTTGIERRQTTIASFSMNNAMKFYAQGGMDIWDPTRYMNIWICDMGNTGILGYGEFPIGSVTNTFGVVIDHTVFGDTLAVNSVYNKGRTTTHEIGHCFNLYHIWGDDGTACSGTDYCSDTPNQGGPTNGICLTFPHTDACTPTGNGIMFENFMDYTIDSCKNLFTVGQSARMNAVLSMPPYDALVTSNACQPFVLVNNDAGIEKILKPNGSVCTTFSPQILLLNWGADTLDSCLINYQIDANPWSTYSWNGSLPPLDTVVVNLPNITYPVAGSHTFTVCTSTPNGVGDAQPSNDCMTINFTIIGTGTALPFFEGFEAQTFPPPGWVVNNPDSSNTWMRTTLAASQGTSASVVMNNFNYTNGTGQKDELSEMLPLNLNTVSNPVLTFDVAYVYYKETTPATNQYTDTLTIFVSTDCGQTYTYIYKKGGLQLATTTPIPNGPSFVPNQYEWQFKVVSLQSYQWCTRALFKFVSTSDWGNNMYIDNINITNATDVKDLDLNSFVNVYPNPSPGMVNVEVETSAGPEMEIRVVDVLGRTITALKKQGQTSGTYTFDLSAQPAGIYFVQLITANGVVTRKVVLDKK